MLYNIYVCVISYYVTYIYILYIVLAELSVNNDIMTNIGLCSEILYLTS